MEVQICSGKTCAWKYSKYITARLENDLKFYGKKNIKISGVTCMWNCKKAPNIRLKNTIHNYMNPAKVSELIQKNV